MLAETGGDQVLVLVDEPVLPTEVSYIVLPSVLAGTEPVAVGTGCVLEEEPSFPNEISYMVLPSVPAEQGSSGSGS